MKKILSLFLALTIIFTTGYSSNDNLVLDEPLEPFHEEHPKGN
ncbi:hypothetical protein [Oceanobacillus luteolus]|nr:hypothetical protein [Oceanobacillus luteolus]